MVSDSFSFIQNLFPLDVNSNTLIMACFDIRSLFTNIPLDETIDTIVSKLFNDSFYFQNFIHSEFIQLLSFAVKNCHFFFNGILFEQTDGVAMGSPLGPDMNALSSLNVPFTLSQFITVDMSDCFFAFCFP